MEDKLEYSAADMASAAAALNVSAMARVLSDLCADTSDIDRDYNWAMCGQGYIEDVRAMLAAQPQALAAIAEQED